MFDQSNGIAHPHSFAIGGALEICRLGFGSARLAGPGVWGAPEDRAGAIRLLRMLPALGVNFIDTADSYGPDIVEDLIREALYPYRDLVIATKAGLRRSGPDQWEADGDPEYLRAQVHNSLSRLRVDCIDLWQLHRIDPKIDRAVQFSAISKMVDEGLIRHVGLSEVGIAEIEAALPYFPVATVQNRYNLLDRMHEPLLRYCEAGNIGFVPWYPIAAGALDRETTVLNVVAKKYGVEKSRVAIAWILAKSPVLLPIPGTSNATHLKQNVAARSIVLSEDDVAMLDTISSSMNRVSADMHSGNVGEPIR